MSEDHGTDTPEVRAESRRRVADRLGFLLAKRWLRLQQNRDIACADRRLESDEAKQG